MKPLFRTLASRLVVLGVVQMLLVGATAVAIFVAEGPHDEARPDDHVDRATRQRLEHLVDDAIGLGAALDELRKHRIEVSLYDDKRQLIASNVEPPLAIPQRRHRFGAEGSDRPSRSDRPAPDGLDGADGSGAAIDGASPPALHSMVAPFMVHGQRGFLIARGVHGEPPGLTGPILTLACGLVVLVIGALITARWIVRPINELSRVALALGGGELGARSRLDRADEIGQLGRGFDEMADRIEGLLVSEKELLANVAHELRTPLSRIGVALDLASEGDSEAARSSLAEIAVDVSELETIVDDILTTIRFEISSGKVPGSQLPLRRSLVAPNEIANAAADRFRSRYGSRELILALGGDLPEIHVDPMLFRRVLDNLLANAHKYSPDPDAPITLHVRRSGDAIELEVSDRGAGISAEDLPRVFTPFFRGDRSRSRESGGVGLGLTLAKRIVEAHAGTITVASASGDGTRVVVAVPVA